ncbi:helicase-related protein [bacterium]|nr:helicase-related protein [bacterium]
MNSIQIFRKSLEDGHPPSDLFEKPTEPNPPLDAAVWRFLKSWDDAGGLGADQAVLFRQVMRWGGNGVRVNLSNLEADFTTLLGSCGVTVDATGIVNTEPFLPAWIRNDELPDDGIDAEPTYRQDRQRLPAEHYLNVLQRSSRQGTYQGFDHWKSSAQKEGAWLTVNANPGSTNLVVLPTGMGKSLCFQLLPIFSGGLTVVVVPTVALAMDQCASAKIAFRDRKDVNPLYYAANDPDIDPTTVVDLINQGRTRLVFTSPEACVSGRLNYCLDQAAKNGTLENLVLDEAHLVSTWGMYFRVDFQLLSGLRRKWKKNTQGKLRTFLFTATLTPDQKQDVFGLYSEDNSEVNDFLFHSLRPELTYFDRSFQYKSEQLAALDEAVWMLPRPAIVYSTEVAIAEQLFSRIQKMGFIRAACFTGKTRAFDRRRLLEQWRNDELDLMVATSAFGLGVDKSDIRSVIHCCLPEDLNRYYQEVGRGGRDGYSSISLLIPSENDIKVARGMKPKLLSTDLVQKRWRALWETKQEVNADQHTWKIRLNSKRPELLGDRTYQENIKWNKRLVLQLSRASQIEILDISFDSELSKELGEIQEFVTLRLKNGFNPDSPKVGKSIKSERKKEADASGQGFESLQDYLSANRCISLILRGLYGEDTHRCCGGCRWCRNEDREATEAPVYELSFQNITEKVRIVEGCEHPISGKRRVFIKSLRRFFDMGIRRFACSATFHEQLLEIFTTALKNQDLFRLDGIEAGSEFELLKEEDLVVFHLEKPTRSLVEIGGASSVTHVLCGSLGFNDIRYPLSKMAINPEYCSKIELWS